MDDVYVRQLSGAEASRGDLVRRTDNRRLGFVRSATSTGRLNVSASDGSHCVWERWEVRVLLFPKVPHA